MPSQPSNSEAERPGWLGWRSFAIKIALLVAVFAAVPAILYSQFQTAEDAKRALMLNTVQEQGGLIAEGLRLVLERQPNASIPEARGMLERLSAPGMRIKLLLRTGRPADPGDFFYVASIPPVPNEQLDREQRELLETGILQGLPARCEGGGPVAVHHVSPTGGVELLISVAPIRAESGCWVVVSSLSLDDFKGSWIGRPYWMTTEILTAAAIYAVMVAVVLSLFVGVWHGLTRFARQARAIRDGDQPTAAFAAQNRMPELAGAAQEFDRMVAELQASARAFRYAAEENAHAFKTPIATIAQALEPIKRAVPPADLRGRRSLELVEASLSRLDALVGATRRIEETIADLVIPPRAVVDLKPLLDDMCRAYSKTAATKGVRIAVNAASAISVRASADLIETVIENLLDNALGFTPPGQAITVTLRRTGNDASILIEDQGPGVDPVNLDRIFERYFSLRPAGANGAPRRSQAAEDSESHFGIGLWIVRRNIEAVGGTVRAENRAEGGLRIVLTIPVAR